MRKGGKSTRTIELKSMRLVDIPPNQNMIFYAAKQGRNNHTRVESENYRIDKNTVDFEKPLVFEYEFPKMMRGKKTAPLRISFRMENPSVARSSGGFKRYGIVEIDITQHVLDNNFVIKSLLTDCDFNTYLVATLALPKGMPWQLERAGNTDDVSTSLTGSDSASDPVTSFASLSTSFASNSTSRTAVDSLAQSLALKGIKNNNERSYRSVSLIEESSFNGLSLSLTGLTPPSMIHPVSQDSMYATVPVPVSYDRFQELEKQINELLAPIINNREEATL